MGQAVQVGADDMAGVTGNVSSLASRRARASRTTTTTAQQWNWRTAARCRVADAEDLFVRGSAQREARMFCQACPVRTECLAHALDERVEFGVWGGMTERERRALLRSRPEVESWAELLGAARDDYYRSAPRTAS